MHKNVGSILYIDVKYNAYIFRQRCLHFFAIWGRGLRSTCSHQNNPCACAQLTRAPSACSREARESTTCAKESKWRPRMRAQPKVWYPTTHASFAVGDWRNSLLETERRTWSDKLKWRLAVVSEGSAETRRFILLVGGFWIFRRSVPLWRGPQRCVSKFGCRSAMLSQRSPGFFFDERARKRFVELPHVRERASAGVKSLDQLAGVHVLRERSDIAKRGCFWRTFGSPLSSSWPVADLDRHGGYR